MEKKIQNYKVNYEAKAIEVKEAFARKAGVVGSDEYKEFNELRKEYSDYQIIVIKRAKSTTKKKSATLKGINCEFLYDYAAKHEKGNSVEKFEIHKNNNASFLAVKKTFLEFYPEFKDLKTKGEWLYLANVA